MLYFEAIYIHSFYPNIAWHVLSIYNKNEHLKSTYVCSKGFTCLLSYPLTLLVVASLFIYTSFCFFQGSPWWQERLVYGIITALRNSFSIHGEITHFKVNKTNWIFEITPTYYLISFVDLCFFLQHGDRQQHLVGGRDHASWNVFSQRLKVNKEAAAVLVLTGIVVYRSVQSTCSRPRNSEAPQVWWTARCRHHGIHHSVRQISSLC